MVTGPRACILSGGTSLSLFGLSAILVAVYHAVSFPQWQLPFAVLLTVTVVYFFMGVVLAASARLVPPLVGAVLLAVAWVGIARHIHNDLVQVDDRFKFKSLSSFDELATRLVFARTVAAALLAPFFGLLSDYAGGGRGGRMRAAVMVFGLVCLSASYALGRSSSATPALYVGQVARGVGLAALLPAAAALMRRVATKRNSAYRHLLFGLFVAISNFTPMMAYQAYFAFTTSSGAMTEVDSVTELALTCVALGLAALAMVVAAVLDSQKEDLGAGRRPSRATVSAARSPGSDWKVATFFSESNPLLALLAEEEGDDELFAATQGVGVTDDALDSLLMDDELSGGAGGPGGGRAGWRAGARRRVGCCGVELVLALTVGCLSALASGALAGAEDDAQEFVHTSFDAKLSLGFVSSFFSFAAATLVYPASARALGSAPVLVGSAVLAALAGGVLPVTFPNVVVSASGAGALAASAPQRVGLAFVLAFRSVGEALLLCSTLVLVNGSCRSTLSGLANGLAIAVHAIGQFAGEVLGHSIPHWLPPTVSTAEVTGVAAASFLLPVTVALIGWCGGCLRRADPPTRIRRSETPAGQADVDALFDL